MLKRLQFLKVETFALSHFQMLILAHFQVDLYYPIFMTFRFLFVFGWLRVAETLYNPFGEDDDDFELNELLNRHFKVS